MTWLLDRLAAHARHQPRAVALEDAHGEITYSALHLRVARQAERLRAAGVRRLALAGGNSPAWVVADLAAQQLRIPVVPVPPFFSDEQRRHLMHEARLDHRYDTDGDQLTATGVAPASSGGPAKITFTSGSTGTPKGVCLDDDHLRRTVIALADALAPHAGARHLCVLPLATLLENVAGVYVPLWLGARVMLPDLASLGFNGSARLDPAAFAAALQQWRPHSVILVPELLRVLTMMAGQGVAPPPSLRFIAVGGGKVDPGLLTAARHLGLPVFEGYGLSECGSVVALNVPGADRPGSVGRVLPHARVRVDEHGEIHVRDAVMQGYLDQPAGDEWPTGDLGRLDADGFLYVHGRRKNLLITAFGRNVSPEWVETAFQVCTTVHGLVVQGDGEASLRAVVVPLPGADPHQLRAQIARVNEGLPDYARVTRIAIAEAPFTVNNGLATANGRPRRDAIAQRYPDSSFISVEDEHTEVSHVS
ncbi:AMP-binding protein [Alloalcanivorax gelatiniphagus]|uniref:Long-chain fatty acid--CoA ligase n=1 Tax=Alloalcanivorax gelatiniphagus TaxID=1194167 RepID=A0ABY2XL36_9GAMM|nr:AMP-binding protein [Alloalcanivorax gelatiniphagus]TMW12237.1 long-chain fatty acid--CoA ligase [Alloalcanivorax gelatiniphagus]